MSKNTVVCSLTLLCLLLQNLMFCTSLLQEKTPRYVNEYCRRLPNYVESLSAQDTGKFLHGVSFAKSDTKTISTTTEVFLLSCCKKKHNQINKFLYLSFAKRDISFAKRDTNVCQRKFEIKGADLQLGCGDFFAKDTYTNLSQGLCLKKDLSST